MSSQSSSKISFLETGHKKCKTCKKVKPLSTFYTGINGNGNQYTEKACRACSNGERNKRKGKTPETYIRHIYSQLKYKRKNTHDYKITVEDLLALYKKQKGRCALSGTPMTHIKGEGYTGTNISIDRIDPDEQYVPKNIQLICYAINMMKWTQKQEDLIEWCRLITKNQED